MARLNPIEQSEFIEKEFREYLKDTFNFDDEEYQKKFIEELDGQALYKGPYLNVTLPFVSTKSINELINDGIVSPLFRNISNINLNQKLYKHQEEAIDKICNGKNVVITTGTGSGKTESFLYPILNTILKDIEKGNNECGIRAIFLYPMNALVNDQIDRVRKMLIGFSEIRYGFFTGDTEEKYSEQLRGKISNSVGMDIPDNEIISREEIRNNPPHLLFTNYSMLEYLLIRPNDFKIFTPQYLNNWKYIVLDEAHTYNGALGIEISLLLRRLTGLCDKKPNFILTSATLGKKNRDEDEIISFAESLTSSKFDRNDIIFASRKKLDRENIEYSVVPNIYSEIDGSLNDMNKLKNILKDYINVANKEFSELLYDFLIKDKNIYDLFDILSTGNLQFKEVMNSLRDNNFSNNDDLVSLIKLINKARKDSKNIYDIKYHTFIRTLSGAYITLKPQKNLKLSPCYYINNLRTFELGNCIYCNAMYIFGKIVNNHFLQNTDIDIYENYGDSDNFNVDYFLLADSMNNNSFNKEICEEYILCGNCGYIYDTANKNAKPCDCLDDFKEKVYKVRGTAARNNIYECPCCSHHSNNGVVRSVNLGKDAATAILSQILYKSIDDKSEEKENDNFRLSLDRNNIDNKDEKKYIKQFIVFSDSRQQASFFATFFEANHDRFLRKRLIWDIIQKNNYNNIRFDSLVSQLDTIIERKELFSNDSISSNKQAWITALTELLNVDGGYGAESLGIFFFTLDIDNILSRITDEDIEQTFGKYNINRQDLYNVINVLFNVFRTSPAIDYSLSGLTPEEKKEYLSYRRFDNYVKLKKEKMNYSKNDNNIKIDGNIKSLIPVNDGIDNNATDYIKKVFNCNTIEAGDIIAMLFNVIGEEGNLFDGTVRSGDIAYQISTSKYILKNYKTSNYYKCNKCGFLTPFNVHNVCPNAKCNGVLYECHPDTELKNNYYRKEYMTKKIERINIKEHTAQLNSNTAKEYQKDFKNKRINILSCSTTFEMGVDIGGLETVFMRNVPPTPANYVQRAGRAGRRDDSSAFILTFCGNTSHDYTYFENPEKMISGEIKPPKFKITNEKIILRHLLATAFGSFFRKNEQYYKNIEALVCSGGLEEFKKYLKSKPEDLNTFINNKILDKDIYDIYSNFKWLDHLKKNNNNLDVLESSIKDLLSQFNAAKESAVENDDYESANYYKNQIETLKRKNVIEELSMYAVIPKYGFPVDVVDLQIWKNGKLNNDYDLSRDLSIAISEYAPDSEVIVDKQKYTSQYINLPKIGDFTKYYYYTCPNCERDNINEIKDNLNKCVYCGLDNDNPVLSYFIEPIYGFKTGISNKESSRKKPKKTYSGMTSYIGNGITDNCKLEIGLNGYITIETSSNDELLVMNKNPFYMCQECGYSRIIKGRSGILMLPEEHLNYKGVKCFNENLHLISLGHKFMTDVVKITIKNLDRKDKALSLLYALLEGISQAFNIERRDIDGIVVKNVANCYDLIIYDNVPGGAGHVKRIIERDRLFETFRLALEKVKQNCCDENSSCYNCLRNYNNQSYHKLLKRNLAIEALNEIFNSIAKEQNSNLI